MADELSRRGVPMIFLTGYDCTLIPASHAAVPCVTKPASYRHLIQALQELASPVS